MSFTEANPDSTANASNSFKLLSFPPELEAIINISASRTLFDSDREPVVEFSFTTDSTVITLPYSGRAPQQFFKSFKQ